LRRDLAGRHHRRGELRHHRFGWRFVLAVRRELRRCLRRARLPVLAARCLRPPALDLQPGRQRDLDAADPGYRPQGPLLGVQPAQRPGGDQRQPALRGPAWHASLDVRNRYPLAVAALHAAGRHLELLTAGVHASHMSSAHWAAFSGRPFFGAGMAPALLQQPLLDGIDPAALAAAEGPPLHVYSAPAIRERLRGLQRALEGLDALVCYAVKANSNQAVLALMAAEGAGADIVSAGELWRSLRAGIPADRIVFSGVGKSAEEIVL